MNTEEHLFEALAKQQYDAAKRQGGETEGPVEKAPRVHGKAATAAFVAAAGCFFDELDADEEMGAGAEAIARTVHVKGLMELDAGANANMEAEAAAEAAMGHEARQLRDADMAAEQAKTKADEERQMADAGAVADRSTQNVAAAALAGMAAQVAGAAAEVGVLTGALGLAEMQRKGALALANAVKSGHAVMAEMHQQHGSEVAEMHQQHDTGVVEMHQQHDTEVAEVHQQHDAEVAEMHQQHGAEAAEMHQQHDAEVAALEQELAEARHLADAALELLKNGHLPDGSAAASELHVLLDKAEGAGIEPKHEQFLKHLLGRIVDRKKKVTDPLIKATADRYGTLLGKQEFFALADLLLLPRGTWQRKINQESRRRIHEGYCEKQVDEICDDCVGETVTFAGDETRVVVCVGSVCKPGVKPYFVGPGYHPSPLKHPTEAERLPIPIDFGEAVRQVRALHDEGLLAVNIMIEGIVVTTNHKKPFRVTSFYPHARADYTSMNQIEAWLLMLWRGSHHSDGSERPKEKWLRIMNFAVDSCGPQRAAMVYMMTPNEIEVQSGKVYYIGLGDDDHLLYGKQFWRFPCGCAAEFPHLARNLRKPLFNPRLFLVFSLVASTGGSETSMSVATWSVLEQMKEMLSEGSGFLNKYLDFNSFQDQKSDAAMLLLEPEHINMLESLVGHVPAASATILYLRACSAIIKPVEKPSFGDATAAVESMFTGYYIFLLQRRYVAHHKDLTVEFNCISSETYSSLTIMVHGVVNYILMQLREYITLPEGGRMEIERLLMLRKLPDTRAVEEINDRLRTTGAGTNNSVNLTVEDATRRIPEAERYLQNVEAMRQSGVREKKKRGKDKLYSVLGPESAVWDSFKAFLATEPTYKDIMGHFSEARQRAFDAAVGLIDNHAPELMRYLRHHSIADRDGKPKWKSDLGGSFKVVDHSNAILEDTAAPWPTDFPLDGGAMADCKEKNSQWDDTWGATGFSSFSPLSPAVQPPSSPPLFATFALTAGGAPVQVSLLSQGTSEGAPPPMSCLWLRLPPDFDATSFGAEVDEAPEHARGLLSSHAPNSHSYFASGDGASVLAVVNDDASEAAIVTTSALPTSDFSVGVEVDVKIVVVAGEELALLMICDDKDTLLAAAPDSAADEWRQISQSGDVESSFDAKAVAVRYEAVDPGYSACLVAAVPSGYEYWVPSSSCFKRSTEALDEGRVSGGAQQGRAARKVRYGQSESGYDFYNKRGDEAVHISRTLRIAQNEVERVSTNRSDRFAVQKRVPLVGDIIVNQLYALSPEVSRISEVTFIVVQASRIDYCPEGSKASMKKVCDLKDTNMHVSFTAYERDKEGRYKGTGKQMRRLALDSTLRMRVLQRVVLTDSGSIDGGVESDLRSRGLLPLEDAEGALLPPVLIKRPVTARTKPPPLDVAELDGAITSFRAAATQTERNKLNAVIVGDLLVSVNGQRCNNAFERRRLMIQSFSTSSKIELLFWRPPDGFVAAVAPGAGAGGSGSGSGGGIGAAAAGGGDGAAEMLMNRAQEETRHANASTTAGRQNSNFDRLVRQLQGGAKTERDLKRIVKQLGLSWQGMMTSKRAVELKLQSLNFPSYFAFVPTAEDMKLSPRAFHRKMCSGQEVAGHAGFYVMVQYSVSQLCNELQKLESWSAALP